MEALEYQEDAVKMLWVYPNAVILDGEDPLIPLTLGRDVNLWGLIRTEFDGVANKVLEQLDQLRGITLYYWQGGAGYVRIRLLNGHLQIGKCLLQEDIAVRRLKEAPMCTHTGIGQQGINKPLHPGHPIYDEVNKFVSLFT